ncbi:ATP-binding protein [candidate division KSB1 bacterium]|nr:ATP-binding protein [candidate division KSB1 bacterium]
MKIQAGLPVSGSNFFIRGKLIDRAWDLIETGNHILIAAPRRVGKTSLMYYLRDNPRGNYSFLYLDTESINNENEFFRRIVNKVLKVDFVKNSQKVITFLERHRPTIKKLGLDGVEFGVREEHDYMDMLIQILTSPAQEGKKLIIMLDEFPETLENIINDEGDNQGRHFLQSNRALRHNREVSKNVQFIYTGSIGLENAVSRLNAIKTINDLSRLKIPPFEYQEGRDFIARLTEHVEFDLSETLIDYILEKIEWLIPFYIQLVLYELKFIHKTQTPSTITKRTIDLAFSAMLEQRNHFEHWHTRLRTALKGNDYNFVKDILNLTSEKETITVNEIYNLAVKYELESSYKILVGSLVYDGFINNNDNNSIYRYNSPILRMWWKKNVAN